VKERLVVALDVDSPAAALALAERLAGEAGVVKVGLELFLRGGPNLVRDLRAAGPEVFLDLKFHDIPNTVAGAVRSAAALGARFVTVHASGGRSMLRAAAEAARGTGTCVLAVTVLTSLDGQDLEEAGWALAPREAAERLASLAVESGIGGLVCSALEAREVRARAGAAAVLVTPGIRLPGDEAGDQKRTAAPDEAARAGADYIVVGRPVTRSDDPARAARRFAALFAEGFAARGGER